MNDIAAGHGRHVIVGLSGGVDSAVSAWRLKAAGWRVSALFMVNWTEDEAGYCTAADDFQSARAVCEELDIPLHRVDFSAIYRRQVFDHFLAAYAAGKTPNPDLACNREVKFGPFIDHARRLGADCVATGHYARLAHDTHGAHLLRATDENKDQTYFLATVDVERFENVLFPIGDLTKPEVRELARKAGLPNHTRHDSTGICFIGERHLRPFLSRYLTARPGPILTVDGRKVGEHAGLWAYTLGQRRGLNVGGQPAAKEAPWYVVDKDPARNALIVSQHHDDPRLLSNTLGIASFHWLHRPAAFPVTLTGRVRHRQPLQAVEVHLTGKSGVHAVFATPQRAVVPGQYLVLYAGEECLGGGEITSVGAQDSVS
ncbi:MAG: tRNA 2-thiouridine(34) synthase MnmA [Nevskiaceae bacterium]|nr:MAG: tRNA 2-thiouridine(34) synthase MnmA [Nevskiaceae bacterium]TBR74833.1 MAG: tRNA 2-thiouridine(34) synthase MnmA [Nevskiaceae bacterium]